MRVLSMQGKEVWEILQCDSVYHAQLDKTRESTDYSRDIANLNGAIPIWCYAYPNINYYTIYDGTVLDYLRQEMSLERKNCWDDFYLFEIEIELLQMHIGISYNASGYSRVFSELTIDMVMAVYEIKDSNPDLPFYKTLIPIYTKSDDVITTSMLDCEKADWESENLKDSFEHGDSGRCLCCGTETDYVKNEKHFCSLKCQWEFEQKFLNRCKDIPKEDVITFFNKCKDEDFKYGTAKLCYRMKSSMEYSALDKMVCHAVK